MTEPKPIHRLEETPGGVRVVTKTLSNLYDYRSTNVLKREYSCTRHARCTPSHLTAGAFGHTGFRVKTLSREVNNAQVLNSYCRVVS